MLTKQKSSLFSLINTTLKAFLQKRFNVWLTRRIPQDSCQQINYRNIFIVPTRFGVGFLFFLLLLFLLGTNYQNNVIILISYLLVSFFIVVLHHSFFNLAGLRFQASSSLQGFVGTQLYFPIDITSSKKRFNIRFSFDQTNAVIENDYAKDKREHRLEKTGAQVTTSAQGLPGEIILDQLAIGKNSIRVPYHVCRRGEYALSRVLIVSEYGFGLFKTWTRLDFAQKITAYPKPIAYAWSDSPQNSADNVKNDLESYQDSFQPGQDEFHQLQHYQLGEPFSRVAWKHVARGQGWLTKHYQQALSGRLQLDFDKLESGTLEQRLSWLSYAIKDCSEQQVAFSLKLPNQMIEYDNSSQHTVKCLVALARY